MGWVSRWIAADLRGDHIKRGAGPSRLERSIPTPVLVVCVGVGVFAWLSNLFIDEPRLVDALTEILGLFLAFAAFGTLRQRRRLGRR